MPATYELRDITFRYRQSDYQLTIPELTIARGRTTALIGPNGAGKSTLLRLLAFQLAPDTGILHFAGSPVRRAEQLELRRRIGFVQQNPYLLRGSVTRNILVGLKLRGSDSKQRQSRLSEVAEYLGLTDLLQQPAQSLSGGQRQKVAIAQMLVLQPEVLLLDEPFTHLDKTTTAQMERLITSVASKYAHTVIFSTHDQLRALSLADEVFTLFPGLPVRSSVVNLFHGAVDPQEHVFRTGELTINIPSDIREGRHLIVEPTQIVLSNARLKSSMRNSFQGRLTEISECNGKVRVTIDAGERLCAVVTAASLDEQQLTVGKTVWVSFKSTAVQVI